MEAGAERAAFYDAHRDDDDLWDEPEHAPAEGQTPRAGLTATITVRFSAEEARAIREIARERHAPYSDVVREAVASYARRGPRTETKVRLFSAGDTQPRSQGANAQLHMNGGNMPNSTGSVVVLEGELTAR